MKYWDLHIHTFFSDGENSPIEVLKLAERTNLTGISITDHDNIDAYLSLTNRVSNFRVKIILGMEITTIYNNEHYHLLAYNFNTKNERIINLIKKHKQIISDTMVNIEKHYKNNSDFNDVNVSYTDFKAFCKRNNLSLFHKKSIVTYLVHKKLFQGDKNQIKEYFFKSNEKFFKRSNYTHIKQAIKIIKDASGFSILAHPFEYEKFPDLEELVEYGISGIEINHYTAGENERKFLMDFTFKHNLIPTGGSDFHSAVRHKIGANTINQQFIKRLLKNE